MRATTAQAQGEKDKNRNRFPQTIVILVSWITAVDDILHNHEGKKVPTSTGKKGKKKFVQKNFEELFKRRWAWILKCQEAADLIRKRRNKFYQDEDLSTAFETFLAEDSEKRKVGVQHFMRLVEKFEENRGEEGEESDDEESDDDEEDDE